jgi:twitching motility two-component system response regulator PilH
MNKKVLVVDDDPDVRLFSVTVLEENGYTPLEAEDGESGLKMIKEKKPDLVILDVLMPRQSRS